MRMCLCNCREFRHPNCISWHDQSGAIYKIWHGICLLPELSWTWELPTVTRVSAVWLRFVMWLAGENGNWKFTWLRHWAHVYHGGIICDNQNNRNSFLMFVKISSKRCAVKMNVTWTYFAQQSIKWNAYIDSHKYLLIHLIILCWINNLMIDSVVPNGVDKGSHSKLISIWSFICIILHAVHLYSDRYPLTPCIHIRIWMIY